MSKQLIAIDASPNTQTEDILLAINMLAKPWSWQKSESVKKLEEYFVENYNACLAFTVESGRSALQLLLSSIVNPGDEVLIQAFTCLAVPNAVSWAGAKPVFVDITANTYNIDPKDLRKKITKKTKVVVVQHTFGIPAEITEIKKICDEYKLTLIEDCAHALGAIYNDKLVGTYGDGAIFSFNQDKVISGVQGGMLIVKNKKIAQKLASQINALENPSRIAILKLLLHPLIWSLALPLYEKALLGKGIIFAARKIGIFGNTITTNEQNGINPKQKTQNISDIQAKLILIALSRLQRDNLKRIEITNIYKKELSFLPIIFPELVNKSQPIYLRYPIQVKNSEKIFKIARKEGIILGKWYETPIFPWTTGAKKYYKEGTCPMAEKVGGTVVNLPTYPRLNMNDVKRVIFAIKKAYENN